VKDYRKTDNPKSLIAYKLECVVLDAFANQVGERRKIRGFAASSVIVFGKADPPLKVK